MSRIAYVDGAFVPLDQAKVSMQDRGYLFADGIYEVITIVKGVLIDGGLHLDRLERSLNELGIPMPMSRPALELKLRELVRRNHPSSGLIYMQVTRGAGRRNHLYPDWPEPILTMAVLGAKFPTKAQLEKGVKVITMPDNRWSRCDIKSISLLPNIMARNAAHIEDAREAWLINAEGHITEGSTSNAYIVDKSGTVHTHPNGPEILGGITRDVTLSLARKAGIKVVEKPFTPEDVTEASEAFLTSSSSFVLPVTTVNDDPVGNGKPGPVTQKLLAMYRDSMNAQAGLI